MSYPSVEELLARDERNMGWIEYADYIQKRLPLSKQQAYATVGKVYDIPDAEIAEVLGTSVSTVSTQRNKIDFREENGFVGISRLEYISPPVPATRFRHIGSVEYFFYEDNERDTNASEADILLAVDGHDYVCIREQYSEMDEDVEPPLDFGIVKNITETRIYESFDGFLEASPHSPRNMDEPDGFHIEVSGGLYEKEV